MGKRSLILSLTDSLRSDKKARSKRIKAKYKDLKATRSLCKNAKGVI
jgi:hypothetical protein